MALSESGVCRVSFSLDFMESYELRRFFEDATTRGKLGASNGSNLSVPRLLITRPGQRPVEMAVANPTEEASLPSGSPVLNETAEFLDLVMPYLNAEYEPFEVDCDLTDLAPQFIEYVDTTVVNNAIRVNQAFLLEHNDGAAFVSLVNGQNCFEAYRLNLAERAAALKASSLMQTAVKQGPPVGTFTGVQYIDYWLPNATTPTRYFIDPNRAADQQPLLTNGNAIVRDILLVAQMAQERYLRINQTPVPVMERDPNNAGQNRQRCIRP